MTNVGTVEPHWTGSGSAYVDGVQDPTFVSNYLATSALVARAFVQRYPKVTADWYLTYEANLNVIGATRRMIQRTLDLLKA